MQPKQPKIVAYYRVSTQKQGRSGLGLAAQAKVVADYIAMTGVTVVGEFTEVESGRSKDRPQLKAAIAKAKATKASLCVAKLDRVGRRASEVLSLLDLPDVKVIFADSPNAGQLQIGILAVVAQEEALAISTRTKAALAAAKARGTKLGNPNGAAALLRHQAALQAKGKTGNEAGVKGAAVSADTFAKNVWSEIQPLIEADMTDAAIAAHLNQENIPTRRNGRWYETTVRRVRQRIAT